MADVTPTPQTGSAEQAPTWAAGSEDEAAAAFAARLDKPQAPEGADPEDDDDAQAAPADEPEADAEPEADEADPDEAEADEELVEVQFEGKTFKAPPEVQKALLRQADYSRRMNEVGAKEKTLTERLTAADQLIEAAEKRAEALAEVREIDARLQQYEGIDWARVRSENPNQAALAAVELLALRDRRKEAVQNAANIAREITKTRGDHFERARDEMDQALKQQLRGWSDELGTQITQYALQTKVKLETLQQLTDPAVVIALDKARRYDALQAQKSTLKAKAQNAPKVAKPGAPRPAPDARREAMDRLRRDNSQEAAADAFLARMR